MNKLWVRFLILWAVNSLIIYLASMLYPVNFVLGTNLISPFWAIVISGFLLTIICKIARPVVQMVGLKPKGRFMMLAFYWLVNAAAIWLIARVPAFSGFGISRFSWAIGLGFVTNLGQWIARQFFKSSKLI